MNSRSDTDRPGVCRIPDGLKRIGDDLFCGRTDIRDVYVFNRKGDNIMSILKHSAKLLVVLILLLAACANATAEGFFLPTPPPEANQEPEANSFTLPTENPVTSSELPNPSYYLHTEGEYIEHYVTFGGMVMNAQIFKINRAGDAISQYLTSCSNSGYKWDISNDISGYKSYRIYGYSYTAYLVPEYGDKVLLLTQEGMPVQEMAPAPEAYEKNKLLMTVNGNVFQSSFIKDAYVYDNILSDLAVEYLDYYKKQDLVMDGNSIVFFNASAPYQFIYLSIPKSAKTGIEYVQTKKSEVDLGFIMMDETGFTVSNDDEYHSDWYFDKKDTTACIWKSWYNTFKVGLEGQDDYFMVELLYVNGNEYRGRFEGLFNNGSDKVSGTFWVEE